MRLVIAQLYPRQMNLYGDWGNVLALKKRLEWRGIETEVIEYNPGDNFIDIAQNADILVGGGGQDSGQTEEWIGIESCHFPQGSLYHEASGPDPGWKEYRKNSIEYKDFWL